MFSFSLSNSSVVLLDLSDRYILVTFHLHAILFQLECIFCCASKKYNSMAVTSLGFLNLYFRAEMLLI